MGLAGCISSYMQQPLIPTQSFLIRTTSSGAIPWETTWSKSSSIGSNWRLLDGLAVPTWLSWSSAIYSAKCLSGNLCLCCIHTLMTFYTSYCTLQFLLHASVTFLDYRFQKLWCFFRLGIRNVRTRLENLRLLLGITFCTNCQIFRERALSVRGKGCH